ncbi:MAG TPA: acyltransferase family protein [Mycobacteriales bacterium]|nr:acyltransferase family protein [Mycobacteriales bacterium]
MQRARTLDGLRGDRFAAAVAATAAAALALRIAVVLATRHSLHLLNDAADYQRLAQSLLHGAGFGVSHIAAGGGPTALRPPGFPLWLAAVEGLTSGGVTAARLVHAALGAALVPLVVVLARQLNLSRRSALAAGAIVAVLPQLVLVSTSLLSEAVFVPLTVGAVVATLAFRRSGRRRQLVLAAALLSAAGMTRPVGFLFAIPLGVLACRQLRVTPRAWVTAAAAAALLAAPAAAWEVRTVTELGRVVPLTTQGGFLVAGTYNATSAAYRPQPGIWLPPRVDPGNAAVLAAHPRASEAETERLLRDQATSYLAHHPTYVATVVGHNLLRLFDVADPDFVVQENSSEFGIGGWLVHTEQIGTLLLLVLAATGLARGAAPRAPAVWAVPVLAVLATVPAQSFTRFRSPVDPFLAVLAGAAIAARRPRAASIPAQRAAILPLDALTSMRFFAAVAVVLVHVPLLLGPLLPDATQLAHATWFGQFGVGFFFILSGFVLTWSARDRDAAPAFYRRRVARIVPLHVLTWGVTLAVYAVIGVAQAGGPAAAALALVHSWVPVQSYYGAVDTPSWSLSCEAFFYLLFPLLLPRVRAMAPRAQARLAAALVAIPAAAAVAAATVHGSSPQLAKWLVVNAPPIRLVEFVLGILVACAVQRGELAAVRLPVAAAATAASLVVVGLVRETPLVVIVPLLPLTALIAALAHRELSGGVRWLRRGWMVRLGQWSFALYLVHWPALVVAARARRTAFGSTGTELFAITALVAAIVLLAGVLFTLVERPLERLIRPRHDVPVALRELPVGAEAVLAAPHA